MLKKTLNLSQPVEQGNSLEHNIKTKLKNIATI